MEGLILERPHGFLLWRGKQTAIGSDKQLPVDTKLIVVCDGEAYGEIVLGAPAAMNATEFDRLQKEHSIRPEERKLWWADANVLYMHRIKEWLPYQEMRPVVVENGQVVDRPLPELSEADKALLAQVDKLPKTIVLSVEAVMLTDNKAVFIDGLDSSKVNGVLSATLGEFDIAGKELPLYQLALVRCPRFVIDKKKVMTEQKPTEETMADKIGEPVDEFVTIETIDLETGKIETIEDDKTKKPDITANSIRVRVINPGKFQEGTFRTIDVGKDTGIQAVVGKLKGESAMTIQTYIFDKERWSPDEAETWVHDHEGTKAEELDSIKAVWSTAFQNNLPDSSFLYIAPGGEIDSEGKTKPRTLRYFVYKDAAGKIDLPHLRNAIARIPQSDLSQTLKDRLQKEAQTILEKENKKGEKAGQRIGKMMRDKLTALYNAAKDLMTWANYEDQPEEPDDEEMPMEDVMSLFNGKSACGIKEVNGEPWFFTKSTNAFRDRDGEIFSTKSLEQYVAEAEQKSDRGYFNLWHITGTDFAKKEWQGVVGRILIEAGPFLPDAKGQAAKKFFTAYPDGHPDLAPEGWGCSPEYRYLPEERKTGVYQWIWITRTSTLPRAAAANIWTKGGIMALTQQQKEAADKIFGAELTAQIIKGAESETKQLEEAGVDHKAVSPDPETPPVVSSNEPAQAEKEFTLDDIVTAVTKRIETDFTPFTEAMAKMAQEVTALTAEVKALKHEEELKAKAELPRFVLQMKRASQVEETTPKGEELKELKPAEKKPNYEVDPAQAFFGKK